MTPDAYVATLDPAVAPLADQVRARWRAVVPGVVEGVRTGWGLLGFALPARPGRARGAYLGYLLARNGTLVVGFEQGLRLPDPDGLLGGSGRQVREVVLHPGQPLPPGFDGLLAAAAGEAAARTTRPAPA